jgi:hypothetical protein
MATPLVHTILTSLTHSLSSFVVRIEDTVVLLWTKECGHIRTAQPFQFHSWKSP